MQRRTHSAIALPYQLLQPTVKAATKFIPILAQSSSLFPDVATQLQSLQAISFPVLSIAEPPNPTTSKKEYKMDQVTKARYDVSS